MNSPAGPAIRLLPAGDRALIVELGGVRESLALHARLSPLVESGDDVGAWVEQLVVAARTLLVVGHRDVDLDAVARALLDLLADVAAHGPARHEQRTVEVPVRYDGPDLDEVAALTGLSRAEVIEAHTGSTWRVGFGGFAPGFAYLVDGDPRLHVPRRGDPRTRVPAGSVALAGEFSGIYPHESPGGWQLIGTTDLDIWDVDREPPALLTPGTQVRFVESEGTARPRPTTVRTTAPGTPEARRRRALEVVAPGPLTLVEDLGRPGLGDIGVGRSGVADRAAYGLGARLVGQEPGPAALEVTLGGLEVRAHGDVLVALTGAPCRASVDGRPVPHAAPFHLAEGQVLRLGLPLSGLRTYVSVRGGIDVPPVLGSRSTDTLSGLGPPPVAAGDLLPLGPAPRTFPTTEVAPVPGHPNDLVLDVLPGPRVDWFADPGALDKGAWLVSERSNRVGIRLQGKVIERHTAWRDRQLPSEGMVRGAIQVPPNGEPVVFLADHPVTGGYPVIGVVRDDHVDRAAQLRPGERLRLRWT